MFIKSLNRFFLVSILIILPFGCEEMEILFVDCDECYTQKPEFADLTVKFTINDENTSVQYTLYDGAIESDDVIAIDTAYESEVIWSLAVNEYYSVKAEYASGARTIYAVDGGELRTKLDRSSCDEQCYIILGDKLDVRLKY